ncbi:MAG: hypothetical protein EOM73_17630 [Bacteroidia bacterium]|nr:hypothetical protein [Bacteroidia bacterium]
MASSNGFTHWGCLAELRKFLGKVAAVGHPAKPYPGCLYFYGSYYGVIISLRGRKMIMGKLVHETIFVRGPADFTVPGVALFSA